MSSEYEYNICKLISTKTDLLNKLMKNKDKHDYEIRSLISEIEALESLFANYNLGMNVFRRAQGGRSYINE
jgi:colicin import membrane protein